MRRIYAILAFGCLALTAWIFPMRMGGKTQEAQPEIAWYYSLDVPFRVLHEGHLAMGNGRSVRINPMIMGSPANLYLVKPSDYALVRRLDDLRGQVDISTPSQALAFCRLRTSLATFLVLSYNPLQVEVITRDGLTSDMFFGNKSLYSEARRSDTQFMVMGPFAGSARVYGIVSAKELHQRGIRQAQARSFHGGYEIRRTLLRHEGRSNPSRLVDVVEFVEHDGTYHSKDVRIYEGWQGAEPLPVK